MPRKKDVESGEWIGLAWAAWCAGERNLASLGRQFGKSPATIKANLQKYAAARAAEVSDVDPTAEYVDGLQHDLKEALRTYRDAENPNAKVGALRHATQIREKLAAARGVITERKAHELSGPDGGPVQVKQDTTLSMLADPGARALAVQLTERLASGPVEPDEIDIGGEGGSAIDTGAPGMGADG